MTRTRSFLTTAAIWLAAALSPAMAADWVVERVSQPALFTADRQVWNELETGMVVPDSSWIHTGAGGRLMLWREDEMILFSPETMASIVTRQRSGRKTDIAHQYGTLLLDVETRGDRHTTVHTPFLAAVVKGTRFEVSVGSAGGTVRVERGLVETTDIGRGERVDVRPGQNVQVTIGSTEPLSVQGPGRKDRAVKVAARSIVALTPAQNAELARSIAEGGRPGGFDMTPETAAAVTAREAARSGGGSRGEAVSESRNSASANRGGGSSKTSGSNSGSSGGSNSGSSGGSNSGSSGGSNSGSSGGSNSGSSGGSNSGGGGNGSGNGNSNGKNK